MDKGVVGILGGGQLSRMLAEAAVRLGLRVSIWAESHEVPAAHAGFDIEVGQPGDTDRLRHFVESVDVVAFENEFIDCDRLGEASAGRPDRIRPSIEVIRCWQDKLGQKRLLEQLGIPTAPYRVLPVEGKDAPAAQWQAALAAEPIVTAGGILKWSRFGYDGKGVHACEVDPSAAKLAAAAEFCREGASRGARICAEERVRFVREVAQVASAGANGALAVYPLVVSEQLKGVCHRVRGPALALGAHPGTETQAREHARALAARSGIRGTFAIEFFELPDGRLWVNELAPRVHNTGHFSLTASRTSQFENHWRGILELPLGDSASDERFMMLNLLGPPGISREAKGLRLPPAPEGASVYWYDKPEIRPGRKLGHVNASSRTAAGASIEELSASLAAYERAWVASLGRA